jgi:hypothetical protein
MNREAYIDEIKLALTGFVLESELDDVTYNRILDSAFRQTQRYINTTSLMTLDFSNCIDLSKYHVDVVTNVYRIAGYGSESKDYSTISDPVYLQYYAWLGNGSVSGISNYVSNLGAFNQLLSIRNTTSTDLAFKQDKSQNKLYINVSGNVPDKITIEYIPNYKDIEDVTSSYWTDILVRMAVAIAKITVGRIRTRFGEANAIWAMDGATILQEGKDELEKLRDHLTTNNDLFFPID